MDTSFALLLIAGIAVWILVVIMTISMFMGAKKIRHRSTYVPLEKTEVVDKTQYQFHVVN